MSDSQPNSDRPASQRSLFQTPTDSHTSTTPNNPGNNSLTADTTNPNFFENDNSPDATNNSTLATDNTPTRTDTATSTSSTESDTIVHKSPSLTPKCYACQTNNPLQFSHRAALRSPCSSHTLVNTGQDQFRTRPILARMPSSHRNARISKGSLLTSANLLPSGI